jgi:hypothetical protein
MYDRDNLIFPPMLEAFITFLKKLKKRLQLRIEYSSNVQLFIIFIFNLILAYMAI